MTIEINQKIIGFEVGVPQAPGEKHESVSRSQEPEASTAEIIQMHEKLERPERLLGSTYKIRTPLSDHALYVTINDVVLNEGTEHELRRPFEIFINSKNMDHFQWIVALTRILSAVFRKGGDVTFLVEELRSVFDPRGGYFKKGGRYMPSLVAEIGDAIECHMKMIGMIEHTALEDCQKQHPAANSREQATRHAAGPVTKENEPHADFPTNAHLCGKCHSMAVVSMDGCLTCLNCGESKCG